MDERYPNEFVTWQHKTPVGVKVSEVFGMDSKSGKVWMQLAKQIYAEQGESFYREIEHFGNGAPFLYGYPGRISVTHTDHFLVVASLPKTPEVDLSSFNPRTAMGIDAESLSRQQVIKIRNKFLSSAELESIPENNLESNIQAWTVKEAVYKAMLTPGLDFKENIIILSLPPISLDPEDKNETVTGTALVTFPDSANLPDQNLILYSYLSYGCCVTIACSPKCAKFSR